MELPDTIWTVGHSTHPIEEFLRLLTAHGIRALADVRRYAGSRRNPQYSPGALRESLAQRQIDYVPISELGGRRAPVAGSRNDAWRNAAFRGYADYMETEEFARAMELLLRESCARPTAILCAEAVWWRCHRALISDYLKVRGVRVLHIFDEGAAKEHPYTSAATITAEGLTYSAHPGATTLF